MAIARQNKTGCDTAYWLTLTPEFHELSLKVQTGKESQKTFGVLLRKTITALNNFTMRHHLAIATESRHIRPYSCRNTAKLPRKAF